MDKPLEDYLKGIGVTKPIYEKIKDTYNIWMQIDPEFEIKDIFVSEYTDNSAVRQYVGVYFFTDDFILATEDFNDYALEIVPIKNKFKSMKIQLKDYDFITAYPKATMSLVMETGHEYFECRASQKNCDFLKEIIVKYIKPNLSV